MREVARKGILTAVATGSVLASTAGYAYASADAHGVAAGSPGVGSGNAVQVPVEAPVNLCGNTVDVIGLLNPAYGNKCANESGHESGHESGQQSGHDSGQESGHESGHESHGDGPSAGSAASGTSQGSPGVASGNTAQVPVDAPVNACGDSVNVVGAANPAFGNSCGNHESAPTHAGDHTPPPPCDTPPPPCDTPPVQGPPRSTPPGITPPTETLPTSGGELTPSTPVTTVVAPVAATGTSAPAAAPAHAQLASTGAEGLGLIAPAGLALLIGGGVLYRRSRAAA